MFTMVRPTIPARPREPARLPKRVLRTLATTNYSHAMVFSLHNQGRRVGADHIRIQVMPILIIRVQLFLRDPQVRGGTVKQAPLVPLLLVVVLDR